MDKIKTRLLKMLMCLLLVFPLVGCQKNDEQIKNIDQLRNGEYVFGVPSLTYCQEQGPSEFPNAKEWRAFNDIPGAYLALQQDKIDALIQDETMARVEIHNGVSGVKILDILPDMSVDIAVGISPESTIVTELILNTCLNELINSGVIQDMENRWTKEADYTMPEIVLPTGDVPTFKAATAGNLEPFSFYKDGELTGYDIELSRRIAQKLNCKVEFEVNPEFTTLISSTQSGKTDILISNLYVTEERKEQMSLSIPYRTSYGCIVVKDNTNDTGYSSLEQLSHKKIGYESTSTQFESQLDRFLPTSEKVLFNNTADCVVALQNNRIDGFICDLPNAKYIVDKAEGTMILPEYLEEDNYGFMLQKDSPLTAEFNEVIKKFEQTNILKDLEGKWFTDFEHPNKTMPTQDPSKNYTKTIRAATSAIIQPMTYLNNENEVIGYEAELLIRICDELNYKVEFLNPFSDIGAVITSLETNKADVGFNAISITKERMERSDLTLPTYKGAAVIVVKNGVTTKKDFFERVGESFRRTFVVEQRWKMILDGMFMTLIISLCSGIVGLLLGFGVCMLRRKKNKPLNALLKAIVKVIQGTPIVVFLMIMYYVVFGKIDISAVIVAILAFGINFGVYASEIMRSGFEMVDKGQEEAARAIGYSKRQTFFKISFPQAAKSFLPILRGEFISMVKMTSIAGYISVAELTRVGDIIRSKTMEAFTPLIAITVIYFGIAELLTFGLRELEKQLDAKKKPFKIKGGNKNA